MCKPHWNQHTTALRKAAVAAKAADGVPEPEPIKTKAPRTARKAQEPVPEDTEAGIA